MIRALLFDWGNTIMVDHNLPGPMCEWENVSWVEGAEKALERIKGVFPCYIASNAPLSDGKKVLMALDRVGAGRYFTKIYSSFDLGFEKPDERFFSAIIKDLGADPAELVMIGDSYIKDIEGAKKCGIRTVFFNAGKIKGEFPGADGVIYHMEELPDAILELEP